jgi:decarboxylase family protein
MLDKTVVENFMQEENKAMWQVISSTEELPAALEKPVEWHKDRVKFTYIEG